MTSELQDENTVTFVELLDRAEAYSFGFSIEQTLIWEEKVNRLAGILYSEGVLPMRRSCQHERSHKQFAQAVLIASQENLTVKMDGCRSTTQMAVLYTASMLTFADMMVRKGFWSSDDSKWKAIGHVVATEKLNALLPVISLEDLIE